MRSEGDITVCLEIFFLIWAEGVLKEPQAFYNIWICNALWHFGHIINMYGGEIWTWDLVYIIWVAGLPPTSLPTPLPWGI